MRTNWDDIAAIHDPSSFGQVGLDIPGVEKYSDRALLLPARTVVVHDDGHLLEEYLGWLSSKDVSLGPKSVIRVRGRNLYDGLEADPSAMERLHACVRSGGQIQAFNRSDEFEEFRTRQGFGDAQIHSAPQKIAHTFANKAELRRIGAAINMSHAFPEHRMTKDPRRVMAYVKEFLSRPTDEVPMVYCKRTDLAGGYGMVRVTREDDAGAKVVNFLRTFQKNEVLVECWNQTGREAMLVRSVKDPDRLKDVLEDMLASNENIDSFVVRRPVLVSGLGRRRIRRGENLDAACADFVRSFGENELIVEVGYPHLAYSTQYMLGLTAGSKPFLGVTRQLMEGTYHVGNVLTRFLREDRLKKEQYHTMKAHSETFGRYAERQMSGYVGVIGFDFAVVTEGPKKGTVYLLECNPRPTASTYPWAVMSQVEARYPDQLVVEGAEKRAIRANIGIVMRNGVRVEAPTFAGLKSALGQTLFEKRKGVIPFNIRLMELPERRCGIMSVGETLEEAESLDEEACRRLAG